MGVNLMSTCVQIVLIIVVIVNGVVAAYFAKLLADSIDKTGVLSSYDVGIERKEEV
ncbi:MAG: hypothetical protein ACLKAK_10365 [Alkaliphilus sp.]